MTDRLAIAAREWLLGDDPFAPLVLKPEAPMSQDTDYFRRCDINRMTSAEKVIREAIIAVEAIPAADTRLSNAVMLLQQAQYAVADYVDNVPSMATSTTPS